MAKLIYSALTSLDGYVADDDGSSTGPMPDEEVHAFVNDLARPVGTHLLGRRMYEVMVAWETARPSPASRPPSGTSRRSGRRPTRSSTRRTLETASSARTRLERDFDPDAVRRAEGRGGA